MPTPTLVPAPPVPTPTLVPAPPWTAPSLMPAPPCLPQPWCLPPLAYPNPGACPPWPTPTLVPAPPVPNPTVTLTHPPPQVVYPGLACHPDHDTFASMANKGYGFGGILGIHLESKEKAEEVRRARGGHTLCPYNDIWWNL